MGSAAPPGRSFTHRPPAICTTSAAGWAGIGWCAWCCAMHGEWSVAGWCSLLARALAPPEAFQTCVGLAKPPLLAALYKQHEPPSTMWASSAPHPCQAIALEICNASLVSETWVGRCGSGRVSAKCWSCCSFCWPCCWGGRLAIAGSSGAGVSVVWSSSGRACSSMGDGGGLQRPGLVRHCHPRPRAVSQFMPCVMLSCCCGGLCRRISSCGWLVSSCWAGSCSQPALPAWHCGLSPPCSCGPLVGSSCLPPLLSLSVIAVGVMPAYAKRNLWHFLRMAGSHFCRHREIRTRSSPHRSHQQTVVCDKLSFI